MAELPDNPQAPYTENWKNELKPWSERIPAAIEKGEEILEVGREGYPTIYLHQRTLDDGTHIAITDGEVALAKGLWDYNLLLLHGKPPSNVALLAPALRDFTEKIESL